MEGRRGGRRGHIGRFCLELRRDGTGGSLRHDAGNGFLDVYKRQSDYHNNINIQMCYWGVLPSNLAECYDPLVDYIREMAPAARKITREEKPSRIVKVTDCFKVGIVPPPKFIIAGEDVESVA